MSKKISIIIPCYNQGRYVKEAIDSALNQTYKNLEIVCVNDGSTDNSSEIIEEKANSDKDRIIFIDNKQNQGVVSARNQAIDRCHGEYILPLDADDKIHETYVEKAVAVLDANPDIGVVYCKARFFGSKNEDWQLPEFNSTDILFENCVFCSAMFKKSDFIKVGKYNVGMKNGCEDWDLWLSFVEKGFKFFRIDEVLFYYRQYKKDSRTDFATRHLNDVYKHLVKNHVQLYVNNDVVINKILNTDYQAYDKINKKYKKYKKLWIAFLVISIVEMIILKFSG